MKIFNNNKKSYLIIGLICIVSSILGLTYSVFVINVENKRATEMYIGNLIYGINIVNEDNTTDGIVGRNVTLGVGESKIIKVTLTSLNPVDSKYKLQYKVNSGDSIVKYMSTTPSPVKGDIEKETSTNTLEMLIYVENIGSTSSEVSFGASGGYNHNNLNQIALITGYTEIIDEYFISLYSDIQLALTLDGSPIIELSEDLFYDLESYTCQSGSQVTWDIRTSELKFTRYKKQETCMLNFVTSTGYPLLRNKPLGSYVKYNGSNSWRLAYLEGNKPVIVSAGVVGASSDGATVNTFYYGPNNANFRAQSSCNATYTGTCTGVGENANNTWAMWTTDIVKIMLQVYGVSCSGSNCNGYGKDLIHVGVSYTSGAIYRKSDGDGGYDDYYLWCTSTGGIVQGNTWGYHLPMGYRPVIRLLPKIIVTGGSGTSGDPYIIEAP